VSLVDLSVVQYKQGKGIDGGQAEVGAIGQGRERGMSTLFTFWVGWGYYTRVVTILLLFPFPFWERGRGRGHYKMLS